MELQELENFLRGEEEKCPYVCFGNKEIITLSFQRRWLLLWQTLLYFIRTRRGFPAPARLDLIHWATVAPDQPLRFVDSGIRAPSTAHYINAVVWIRHIWNIICFYPKLFSTEKEQWYGTKCMLGGSRVRQENELLFYLNKYWLQPCKQSTLTHQLSSRTHLGRSRLPFLCTADPERLQLTTPIQPLPQLTA